MDLTIIKKLATTGESETLEYKTSTSKLKEACQTLCAFLNGTGGTVLIGVGDKGKIIGQHVTDSTRLKSANEKKKIEPTAKINVHYIKINGNKTVIAMQADSVEYLPYIYDGRPYYRNESETDKMPQHHYEHLFAHRNQINHAWEETLALDYSLDDLDSDEIYKTVSDGIGENRIPASAQRDDIKAILERLNLIKGDKLKHAAVVLYAKQEKLKLVQCMIKMTRFEGIDKSGNFIDNQQIYGNAFKILEEADAFLRRHLPIASFFKADQFKRIDKPTLPVMAVREALINGICHRDYSDRSTDISLAIFADRLEIWNSGTLLKSLTIENLKQKHHSVLRNRLIANVFYVRGMIEKWGGGTNKMVDLCREDGLPEPEFAERTGGLEVVFNFKSPIGSSSIQKPNSLTARQLDILKLLEKSSMNGTQIATNLLDSPSVRTVQKDLVQLEQIGLVKRVGKARAIVWERVE